MVSYEPCQPEIEDVNDEKRGLLTTRNGQKEIITGMVEWQRVGLGWEHVWNLWGWWDPSESMPPESIITILHSSA